MSSARASMGALRAAELAAFGMEGVGEIFAAFESGALATTTRWPSSTAPRPRLPGGLGGDGNIRSTLKAAQTAGVVGEGTRRELLALAKSTFYPRRSWPGLLQAAQGRAEIPAAELAALAAWLPNGRIDQKRADARALLAHLASRREEEPGPKRVSFRFQHTDAWEEARRHAASRPLDTGAGADTFPPDALLDELRHDSPRYRAERRASALPRPRPRSWPGSAGSPFPPRRSPRRSPTSGAPVASTSRRPWRAGWASRASPPRGSSGWCATRPWPPGFKPRPRPISPATSTTDCGRAATTPPSRPGRRDKQAALAARGLDNPSLGDCDLPLPQLWRWYFEERQGRPVPEDLNAYARSLDLPGEEALVRAVLRECSTRSLPEARDWPRLRSAAQPGQLLPEPVFCEPKKLAVAQQRLQGDRVETIPGGIGEPREVPRGNPAADTIREAFRVRSFA